MWSIFEQYEEICGLRRRTELRSFVPLGQDQHHELRTCGCMESQVRADHCAGEFWVRVKRLPPPQLTLNMNPTINLPAGLDPNQIPQQVQDILQQLLGNVQQQIPGMVQQALANSSPIVDYEAWPQDVGWRFVDNWPLASKI